LYPWNLVRRLLFIDACPVPGLHAVTARSFFVASNLATPTKSARTMLLSF
jgi:hypothetical protein